jgi:hypothetical protein
LTRLTWKQVHAAGSIGAPFADASAVTGEPAIEAAARSATGRFATAIADLLERGRRVGELRPDLDTEAAAWWLLSLVASQKFRRATAPRHDGSPARGNDDGLPDRPRAVVR